MKIYEFKSFLIAGTVSFVSVIGILTLFMFGLIWLDKGFKLEEAESRMYNYIERSQEQIKNQIMPSALKGYPSVNSHKR